MALDEIAERCAEKPEPKSILLRFTLAWLFEMSGAEMSKKWVFDTFWQHATSTGMRYLDKVARGTGARSALNGISREVGCERTVSFEAEMKRRRRKLD